MKKSIWLEEIIEAMKELGGHAYYSDLYEYVKDRGNISFNKLKDPNAQIRGTIERYSSDSNVYKKTKNGLDIFYSVDGKGKGHWGLREFEPHDNMVDLTEDDGGFLEGRKKLRQHICIERNAKVIKMAKENFKKKYGVLKCEVCGFNFEKKYGKLGEDFIEGHHIKPVSELKEGEKTKVEDIVLLCSNCHKMIHRKRPWLSKKRLKTLIVQNI
ncbi:restriction endonuclease [Clostridium botulinum]|uniref:Restriction endonuclease n=1 Tax=Clostridium botulinum TaxID=1491 RepID=A0A846J599_CLOBO|nr:HNH endonuclease [Clostridium botulinum]NFH64708.1 restriction endonuclease [Clostridium botulinum]NFJ08522.1 restriction endonuclease [Clostridium botulinum]NFK14918.1 restriction endonuclease [Clostridium botulinum]NFM92986.1 restriction endonuclease [Clostridium botulinum]NFO16915.1 restriction endonuclease [Clostridium botulinum]